MVVFHLHLRFCALENRLNCLPDRYLFQIDADFLVYDRVIKYHIELHRSAECCESLFNWCINEFDIGQTIFLIALRSCLRDIQILNTPENECQEEKPSNQAKIAIDHSYLLLDQWELLRSRGLPLQVAFAITPVGMRSSSFF